MNGFIAVNRAPVLALWAAVVAERQGYEWDEAVSLGKAVAGLTTQNKGEHLGDYELAADEGEPAKVQRMGGHQFVALCGRNVPIYRTERRLRVMSGAKEVEPAGAKQYIVDSFGEELAAVLAAMRKLAGAHNRDDLQVNAIRLYEQFMPKSSANGKLYIDKIKSAMLLDPQETK